METVSIAEGTVLKKPIVITKQKKRTVVVEDNSSATVHQNDDVDEVSIHLGKQSKLTFFWGIAQPGEKKIELICAHEGAQATVHAFYLLNQKQKLSLKTKQTHLAPNTKTNLLLRGALSGTSQLNHVGDTFVGEHAHKTVASQKNKTLLLSGAARVTSCPQLEVFNKTVRCFHGSAVGQFDEQQFLYLRSRGMPEKQACQVLLRAFLTLPFAGCDDKSCNEQVMQTFLKKFQEMV